MTKSVVFILGADFSGTTMLELMLGSHPFVASTGELGAFVDPTSRRHLDPICSCHERCELWNRDRFGTSPYRALFDFHNLSFLTDSTKQPGWVIKQAKIAQRHGYKVRFVLIWKDARDYAVSCAKRGNPNGWAGKWLRYHRSIFQMGFPIYTVSLRELLAEPEVSLRAICDHLELSFSTQMLDYAAYKHHIVFGSATARIRLHKTESMAWEAERSTSLRSDFSGQKFVGPRPPTAKEAAAIKRVEAILSNDGLKLENAVEGSLHLRTLLFRRRVEKLMYKIGIEPGTIATRLRTLRMKLSTVN